MIRWSTCVSVALLCVCVLSGCTFVIEEPGPIAEPETSAASEQSYMAQTEFVTFVDLEMPEQDVFVESPNEPNLVIRVTTEDLTDASLLDQMVYAAAHETEHDEMAMGAEPLGPFAKGQPLGVTLGEWWGATAHGTYTLHGTRATIDVTLENLVPNGVYTAWCGRISSEPTLAIIDAPCGRVDGSENVFQADAEGNAHYQVEMNAAPASTDPYFSDIAFAYHSDGKSYGMHPGQFGLYTHVQLLLLDPLPALVAREPIETPIDFITHVEYEMAEQDVYVESVDDPSLVIRPYEEAMDPASLEQMVYAASEPIEHDPMELGPEPRGPFPKGEALGVTLGEWLAASGHGTYTIVGDQATIDVTFENLVPNGVYTAWCGIITVEPGFAIVDMPCGLLDGSENVFQADAEGNGAYQVTMPALPNSSDDTFSDIAFAYHSDGQTCGSSPCDFGLNSHVHLFIAEVPPAPSDLPLP